MSLAATDVRPITLPAGVPFSSAAAQRGRASLEVAFVVPYVPNLIRARPYNLIRALARIGHRVTVYTLWGSAEEMADAERLAGPNVSVLALPLPRWRPPLNCILALPQSLPLQAAYTWQPALADALIAAVGRSRPEVVHVEHLRGARYALALKDARPEVPVVWDSVDCISYLFEQAATQGRNARSRLLTGFDLERTRRFEALVRDRMDRTLVTSPADQEALEALPGETTSGSPRPVDVVPNGVDLEYFVPSPMRREPDSLIFSGKMSYHANEAAALYLLSEIMPEVWRVRPEAHLWIVGKDPTGPVLAAAATYPGQVTVTGSVPDIRPYIQRASASIAPVIYGAGIQNKILEAMACATPVVAARRATAALSAREGEHFLIFDSAAQAAEQVVGLLGDRGAADRIGRAGRQYVEQFHRWETIAGSLERIYEQSIAGARSTGAR